MVQYANLQDFVKYYMAYMKVYSKWHPWAHAQEQCTPWGTLVFFAPL
jgi:hypothetical protein